MPSLADHHSSSIAKILHLGHSGSGKTGCLASLVKAGYKLRILDTDNLLDSLAAIVRRDSPDKIGNVAFETVRDKYKATTRGPEIDGQPKAYVQCLKLMDKWSDDSIPASWGGDTIFVLDTLTTFCRAAFEWARGLNPAAKDPRQWYKVAQDAVMMNIDLLTSASFNANVIVNAHIKYGEVDNMPEGFPYAVGSAIGPLIPTGFNTVLLSEKRGSGSTVRRMIKTIPTALINVKTPIPFKLKDEYPIESGMAEIFAKLKET